MTLATLRHWIDASCARFGLFHLVADSEFRDFLFATSEPIDEVQNEVLGGLAMDQVGSEKSHKVGIWYRKLEIWRQIEVLGFN